MQTGENIQALRKIMDFTRLLSLAILAIHFYMMCYPVFHYWQLTADITDRLISIFDSQLIFQTELAAKGSALLLLVISLIGVKGKKDEKNRMDYFFEKIATQYTQEVEYKTNTISSLLEPLIISF